MKRRLLKSSSFALLAAALSIWSIACGTAPTPAGTPVPAVDPTATRVSAAVLATTASPTPRPTAMPMPTPVPTAAPAATPMPTPVPTATPAAGPGATATNFNPELVGLPAVGSSTTITVETIGVDSGAIAVQVNVQHPAELQVSSPACAGLFTGATQLGPAPVTGGTAFGCVLLAGEVTGPTGPVMTFELTRLENFTTDQVVTLGVGGPLGTNYSENGSIMDPGLTNRLIVRPYSQ